MNDKDELVAMVVEDICAEALRLKESNAELLAALELAYAIFVGLVGTDCDDLRVTPSLGAMRTAITKARVAS